MSFSISEAVKYVGVDDTELDLFESQYIVPNGISYNSYLIFDEKVALMDTVDARMADEWLKGLMDTLGGRAIDYLVVSHLEPDHAGCIVRLLKLFPDATIVATAKAIAMMPQFFGEDFRALTMAVKENDTLSLGVHTLQFITAPMVHW
ncbi:MAG: FprA family A-type flavoprotein, partial [Lachnospiraceae bacterium]|nr:FprA family A-type flavoprotein [Lachnospiraceae bacterium]